MQSRKAQCWVIAKALKVPTQHEITKPQLDTFFIGQVLPVKGKMHWDTR